MNTALGEGMSSRLFQEVRERRGKAYSIYSFLDSFSDAGYLGVYAALSGESVPEVIEVVRRELSALGSDGLPPAELERAKNQIKGSMLLGLESTSARMRRMAMNEIYFGRQIPPTEVAERISSVTNDQIVSLAASLFQGRRMAATLLGPLDGTRLEESALELPT
jgi:predicted Zn-dependent peptidase